MILTDGIHLITIPNGDFRNWDSYLTTWPDSDVDINAWLDYYERWIDYDRRITKLTDSDLDLIDLIACGESSEDIMKRMDMSRTELNRRLEHFLRSAERFGKSQQPLIHQENE